MIVTDGLMKSWRTALVILSSALLPGKHVTSGYCEPNFVQVWQMPISGTILPKHHNKFAKNQCLGKNINPTKHPFILGSKYY